MWHFLMNPQGLLRTPQDSSELLSCNYLAILMTILYLLEFVPTALAASLEQSSFPDIPFQMFPTFVENNFSKKISLATVLTVIFTSTNNPDLLNLHAHQQKQGFKEEWSQQVSGWIKVLAHSLEEKLGESANRLFLKSEHRLQPSMDQTTTTIGTKFDKMSKLLKLQSYDEYGKFRHKLKPISEKKLNLLWLSVHQLWNVRLPHATLIHFSKTLIIVTDPKSLLLKAQRSMTRFLCSVVDVTVSDQILCRPWKFCATRYPKYLEQMLFELCQIFENWPATLGWSNFF